MPKVTVYIRKEDYPKWQALEAKSLFISDALNDEDTSWAFDDVYKKKVNIIHTPEQAKEAVPKEAAKPKTKLCKHGNPLGQCMDKRADRSCKP